MTDDDGDDGYDGPRAVVKVSNTTTISWRIFIVDDKFNRGGDNDNSITRTGGIRRTTTRTCVVFWAYTRFVGRADMSRPVRVLRRIFRDGASSVSRARCKTRTRISVRFISVDNHVLLHDIRAHFVRKQKTFSRILFEDQPEPRISPLARPPYLSLFLSHTRALHTNVSPSVINHPCCAFRHDRQAPPMGS